MPSRLALPPLTVNKALPRRTHRSPTIFRATSWAIFYWNATGAHRRGRHAPALRRPSQPEATLGVGVGIGSSRASTRQPIRFSPARRQRNASPREIRRLCPLVREDSVRTIGDGTGSSMSGGVDASPGSKRVDL
jgi:hypothetical protein